MKIKYKTLRCKKCGGEIKHDGRCGFGFRYHPHCYAAIYGWFED